MNEKKFHMARVAFIILNNEIKYLRNSEMSHIEWCRELGISEDEFNNIVRGYVYNGEIVYYYGDFKYDERVINMAVDTYEKIARDNGLVNYSVYCGVAKGKVGEIWKPILKIK